mgnify:CR=1 FL=1
MNRAMISHTFLGTNDRERAVPFYEAILPMLGWRRFRSDTTPHLAIWRPDGLTRPLFVLGPAFDGEHAFPGNGSMVALMAESRSIVDTVHATALAAGGFNEGEPGLRPHYHPNFYGAYVRDLDGNKLCIVCHEPDELAK